MHDRTAYAKAVADATERRLKALGVTPLVLTIVAGHRDYPEITGPVKEKGIEALIFAGFPDEAAIILTGLRAAGAKGCVSRRRNARHTELFRTRRSRHRHCARVVSGEW